jgi:signal transduction histidine kinase/ActR/RegA family two-component response regulator
MIVGQPAAATENRVLVLPPTGADALAIEKLFASCGIPCAICRSMTELCRQQRAGGGTLILAEEDLLPGAFDEIIACLDQQPVWSDIPVIVLSRSGREPGALAEMVPRLGNVSVVERPVRTSTLVSLVRSSLRARERQYQVREYLARQELAQDNMRRIEVERERLLASERAARSEAERAGRTKDEVLATLSHELRTPLNAILGWTQVLRKSGGLSDDVGNALTVIERNARAQAQIIEDLLDMSSVTSGKTRLDLQRVDVAAVIDATVETVRPTAEAKGVRLGVTLDPLAGPVLGDPNRLQQVLWNLLTNAVKFTPRNGRVTVALARVGANLQLDVTDTGEGIDPAFLPQVFDRFRQADATSARRHGGLGLGLSIVKQLVELHGGSVWARSEGQGTGSTFRVTLPAMETADPAAPTGAHPLSGRAANVHAIDRSPLTSLAGAKILVVDDDPDARLLIERVLEDRDAVVVTACSAEEGWQALQREMPDVMVSDIGMPGEDGYTLIRRVRAMGGLAALVPAVALTAFARKEDRVSAIRAGFQRHLSKPLEPGELVATIASLVPARH